MVTVAEDPVLKTAVMEGTQTKGGLIEVKELRAPGSVIGHEVKEGEKVYLRPTKMIPFVLQELKAKEAVKAKARWLMWDLRALHTVVPMVWTGTSLQTTLL